MNKAKNIKEARELIKIYQSITLNQIYKYTQYKRLCLFMIETTGFSDISRCKLCNYQKYRNCYSCLYGCNEDDFGVCTFQETYKNIQDATTPQELYNAIQERIKFIKRTIKNYVERERYYRNKI